MTLSTTSVYPESTVDAFACAKAIGYDGVELMVGIDPVAADVDRIVDLSAEYAVAPETGEETGETAVGPGAVADAPPTGPASAAQARGGVAARD